MGSVLAASEPFARVPFSTPQLALGVGSDIPSRPLMRIEGFILEWGKSRVAGGLVDQR